MQYWDLFTKTMTSINFKGRASKKEYICFKVFQFIIGILSLIFLVIPVLMLGYKIALETGAFSQMQGNFPDIPIPVNGLCLYCIISLVLFLPITIWIGIANLCVTVKRIHDFNYSGWYYLVFWIIICILSFSFKNTDSVSNMITSIASFAELVVLVCVKGSVGLNKFDVDIPKDKEVI